MLGKWQHRVPAVLTVSSQQGLFCVELAVCLCLCTKTCQVNVAYINLDKLAKRIFNLSGFTSCLKIIIRNLVWLQGCRFKTPPGQEDGHTVSGRLHLQVAVILKAGIRSHYVTSSVDQASVLQQQEAIFPYQRLNNRKKALAYFCPLRKYQSP